MRWDTKQAKRFKRKVFNKVLGGLTCAECGHVAHQLRFEDGLRDGWLLTVSGDVLCPHCKKIPVEKRNLWKWLDGEPLFCEYPRRYVRF